MKQTIRSYKRYAFALSASALLAALPAVAEVCDDPITVDAGQWTAFSVSCTPDPPTLGEQINEDDLGAGAVHRRTWRVLQRNAVSGRLTDVYPDDNLSPGEVYYMYSRTPVTLEFEGTRTGENYLDSCDDYGFPGSGCTVQEIGSSPYPRRSFYLDYGNPYPGMIKGEFMHIVGCTEAEGVESCELIVGFEELLSSGYGQFQIGTYTGVGSPMSRIDLATDEVTAVTMGISGFSVFDGVYDKVLIVTTAPIGAGPALAEQQDFIYKASWAFGTPMSHLRYPNTAEYEYSTFTTINLESGVRSERARAVRFTIHNDTAEDLLCAVRATGTDNFYSQPKSTQALSGIYSWGEVVLVYCDPTVTAGQCGWTNRRGYDTYWSATNIPLEFAVPAFTDTEGGNVTPQTEYTWARNPMLQVSIPSGLYSNFTAASDGNIQQPAWGMDTVTDIIYMCVPDVPILP